MKNYYDMKPTEVRKLIREGKIVGPTSGMCAGYAQANLVILPKELAYDFLLFTQRNPKSCPILEVSDVGSRKLHYIADDADIATDIPKYRIYRQGELEGEYGNVEDFWQDDFVSFLIGCSFSFESALLDAGLPVRHIEEHCNVPMYKTNIPCTPAGRRSCAACAAAGWTAWSSSLRSWRRACFPGHKKAGDGSSNELPSPACSVENG
mgnify:CR=1 FL=1